jgi:primosomal protein N' (replication factor Y) (superfamily II helicase)
MGSIWPELRVSRASCCTASPGAARRSSTSSCCESRAAERGRRDRARPRDRAHAADGGSASARCLRRPGRRAPLRALRRRALRRVARAAARRARIAVGARSAIFAPLATSARSSWTRSTRRATSRARRRATTRARWRSCARGAGRGLRARERDAEPRELGNAATGKYSCSSSPSASAAAAAAGGKWWTCAAGRRRGGATRAGRLERGGRREPPQLGRVLARADELVEAIARRGSSAASRASSCSTGAATRFVQCRDCGDVWHLPQLQRLAHLPPRPSGLVCHYCRTRRSADRCGRCGSATCAARARHRAGRARARARLPGDARRAHGRGHDLGKWAHHEILDRVERGEVDILLGTQMIAKGLDFPGVTLVGVINADVGINLPGLPRERAHLPAAQPGGGARGAGPRGGEVLIQTSLPDHYAIRAALAHDYESLRGARAARSALAPPTRRTRAWPTSCERPETRKWLAAAASEAAAAWCSRLLAAPSMRVPWSSSAPRPAPIDRLHGRWRWHFLLRIVRSARAAHARRRPVRAAPGSIATPALL